MAMSGGAVITQDTPTGSLLTIRVTRSERGALVSLGGRLTIDSSPELRSQLLAVLYGEALENLVIDLSDVPYVDLSGVATLLETLRVARGRKTGLQLKGLHDRPLYLLEVTGLLSLFETCGINARSIQKAP
jgi:anti-sigma B factor antagonist